MIHFFRDLLDNEDTLELLESLDLQEKRDPQDQEADGENQDQRYLYDHHN